MDLVQLLCHFLWRDINQETQPAKIYPEYRNAGLGQAARGIQQGAVTAHNNREIALAGERGAVDYRVAVIRKQSCNTLVQHDLDLHFLKVGRQCTQGYRDIFVCRFANQANVFEMRLHKSAELTRDCIGNYHDSRDAPTIEICMPDMQITSFGSLSARVPNDLS